MSLPSFQDFDAVLALAIIGMLVVVALVVFVVPWGIWQAISHFRSMWWG